MRDSRLRDSISNRLGKLFRIMAREHNRALKPYGISAVQGQILATLWSEGSMTIGELQSSQALGSSTLTGALDRMERAELVRRLPVAGDRRAFRLEPAPWPAKRKLAMLDASLRADERCFASLTATERQQLSRLLNKALDGLSGGVDDADAE